MTFEPRNLNSWLLGVLLVVVLLYVGQPFFVPLVFALVVWGVLNALVGFLTRLKFPAWLAWTAAFLLIAASLYFVVLVLTDEVADVVAQIPAYVRKLQHIWSSHRWLQRFLPARDLNTLLNGTDLMAVLSHDAGSIGGALADLVLIAIYVGFLLVEQRHLPAKLVHFRATSAGAESEQVIRLMGEQIQSYLGVCTLLSIAMGGLSYVLLAALGVQFAGFWALTMFFLTYIPVVGAVGAVLPALMALLQFGAPGPALIILAVLSAAHFILTDIVETVMLGHSLDLSEFVIMVALTFWGLIWGIPGLFLAVPLTSAFAIACRHLEGLGWIADLISGPPRRQRRWRLLR